MTPTLVTPPVHGRRGPRPASSGFTLIELMFSLVIGSIALTAIYTVVGGSTRVFHEQHRLGGMQTSLRRAMSHVTRDIQRAGFLSTPSARMRNETCNDPDGVTAPLIDNTFAGVRFAAIAFWDEVAVAEFPADNDLTEPQWAGAAGPGNMRTDRLTLLANYETNAQYAGTKLVDGTTNRILIEPTWHAFERDFTTWATTTVGPVLLDRAAFDEAYLVGRALRIQTSAGKKHFAVITSIQAPGPGCDGGMQPWDAICVTFNPPIPPGGCDKDATNNSFSNPVSFIQYRLAQSLDVGGKPLNDIERQVTGANIQLQRVEMGPTTPNVPLPLGANSVVLDYATMFNLVFLGNSNQGDDLPDVVNRLVPMNPMDPATGPEQVRSVVVEMATRSPIQDPRYLWDKTTPVSRFLVHDDGRAKSAARVRYARAEVFVPNVSLGGF